MITAIVFILILGLIVLVHELGHFITAKRAGVRVEEFGIGFPPRIFKIKRGETIYSINLFPLGGFVKIYGEDGQKEDDANKGKAFYSKPIGTRAKIIVAGVVMNLVLSAFLLGIGHWIGLPDIIEDNDVVENAKIQIVQVSFDSPAEEEDIKVGDTIKELRKDNNILLVSKIGDIQDFTDKYKGEKITIVIERGDTILEKEIVPRIYHADDEGPLGIALARTAIVSLPWYHAFVQGIIDTIKLTWLIAAALATILWQLITTGRLTIDIAGPVGIYDLAGQATKLGFIYILQFTAILNINLAIINALPFPALDGGRLLFLLIEKIKGSPISQKVEGITHTVGFALLILLMIAVTWRDIVRIF